MYTLRSGEMEENTRISCHNIEHCSYQKPNSEVAIQKVIIESGERSAFNVISESEDPINNEDVNKTFVLAENIEVYEPKYQNQMQAEVSFNELVELAKQHKIVHFNYNEKLPGGDEDISHLSSIKSNKEIEFNSNDTLCNIYGEKYTTNRDIELCKEIYISPEQSFSSFILESKISETLTSKENTDVIEISKNDDADDGVEQKIIQINDGHKEFKIQNVDESQLALDHETSAKLIIKDNRFLHAGLLIHKTSSTLIDEMSPSTDINNQDTIGPLENPAFLKTLQYSVSHQPTVSQPVVQDELFGLKSNIDIRSLSVLPDPPDLDKGWAWVVLGAGFTASAFLGATIYASGVFILAILKDVNPDLTKVSWVGSLFVCSMCLSGPFVEFATKRFGTRVTVFCAGIVITIGFIGASLARNIIELILTHGFIAGVGAGFIANPISVSVGQYFNRYRGLACGLMATGAGAGMLTGGAVISVLLNQYGLSGTYLLWAGVLLHTTILALLLRPSPEERLRTLEKKAALKKSHQQFNNQPDVQTGFNSSFGSMNHSVLSGIDRSSYGKKLVAPRNLNKMCSEEQETLLLNNGHELSYLTPNQNHPSSHITNPLEHHVFCQNFALGDLQYISLSESPTPTPKNDSPPSEVVCNQSILAGRVSHYGIANIQTAPNFLQFSPNVSSFTSKSTCGLDKISDGKRGTRHTILSKISYGDQSPITKSAPCCELSQLSNTVSANQLQLKSYVTNPSLCNKLSQNFGLGDRQFESLSTSPLAISKPNSPPTIHSVSQHTLTSDVPNSPSTNNVHVALESSQAHPDVTSNSPPFSPPSIRSLPKRNKIQRHYVSQGSLSQHTSVSHSSLQLSLHGSLHPSHVGEMDSESITSALVSQPRPREVLTMKYPLGSRSISTFMGSVPSIPIALAIVKDDVSRYETFSTVGVCEKGLKGFGIKILDSLRLLRRKPFFIFLAVCFLWAFGEAPVMIYLPSFAISLGTSPILASVLYSAMGTGSILGRFFSGLTAMDSSIGPVILYTGCLGVAGLLVALGPQITVTFIEQLIFSCLAGIYTGALVPLSSLIVIEMLDIGELGIGFGFISLAQGFGYLIGPPLASIIVRAIGYRNSFVLSGFVLMSGSIVSMTMSSFLRDTGDEEQESHTQKYGLMKAMQKITEIGFEKTVHGSVNNVNKTCAGPVNTKSEVKESSKVIQVNGANIDGSKEISRSHDYYPNEEKLDTIMEVV